MYAEYHYKAGSTITNILNDIAAMLTGETNVASLSGDCITANSVIISAVAAGWTEHDYATGINSRIIKSPHADNAALYKYLEIVYQATDQLYFRAYETWDAGSNTGTNVTSPTSTMYINLTKGGILFLFSSVRFAAITSFRNSVYELKEGILICAEYSRGGQGWNNNTVPACCVFSSWEVQDQDYSPDVFAFDGCYMVRCVTTTGTTQTGSNAKCWITVLGHDYGYMPSGTPNDRVFDASGNPIIPLFAMFLDNPPTFGPPIGVLSGLCDFWCVPENVADTRLTFQVGGNDYIVMPAMKYGLYETRYKIAFRKG